MRARRPLPDPQQALAIIAAEHAGALVELDGANKTIIELERRLKRLEELLPEEDPEPPEGDPDLEPDLDHDEEPPPA